MFNLRGFGFSEKKSTVAILFELEQGSNGIDEKERKKWVQWKSSYSDSVYF